MSTKKRFSISAELASGIRSSVQSASTHHGQLHYDMMPMDVVEPDPANPRQLSVTLQELKQALIEAPTFEEDRKTKEFEALKELAESIKKIGVRNAIEVYKEGQKYRIISGERRYLASILAGQQYIPARINQKPDEFKLRYTQWVENINRQDLSLWEKYNNLISMADAHQKTHQIELDAKQLQRLLGVSDIQAYRYFCLLKAEQEIISLVQSGRLSNLKIVQELVTIKDKRAQERIIAWLHDSKEEVTSLAKFKTATSKKTSRIQPINLGRINDVRIARYLAKILLSNEKLSKYQKGLQDVDWSSPQSINKAFKNFFKKIEKELILEEVEEC